MATEEDHALSVRLPEELYERLRRYAFERRVPQAAVIRTALENHLESNGQHDNNANQSTR